MFTSQIAHLISNAWQYQNHPHHRHHHLNYNYDSSSSSSSSSSESSSCSVAKENKSIIDQFGYLGSYLPQCSLPPFQHKHQKAKNQSDYIKETNHTEITEDYFNEIAFLAPPIKLNSSGYYHCLAAYKSKCSNLNTPFNLIMLLQLDPYKEWSVTVLELNEDKFSPAKFWNDSSHYSVINNHHKSTISFYNKEFENQKKQHPHSHSHYQLNFDIKKNNGKIKTCTESDVINLMNHSLNKKLWFDTLYKLKIPQIFPNTKADTKFTFHCDEIFWELKYNQKKCLLVTRGVVTYTHFLQRRIYRLYKSKKLSIIQDRMSGTWYQIYFDGRRRGQYKSIFIIKISSTGDDYIEINKHHLAKTKIDVVIYNNALFVLSHWCKFIYIFSLSKSKLIGKYKTNVYRPRSSTYLTINTRIFDAHYILKFAASTSSSSSSYKQFISSDICHIIDQYIDKQHWKHEICLFPRVILVDPQCDYDETVVIINLVEIIDSLEFLCLI